MSIPLLNKTLPEQLVTELTELAPNGGLLHAFTPHSNYKNTYAMRMDDTTVVLWTQAERSWYVNDLVYTTPDEEEIRNMLRRYVQSRSQSQLPSDRSDIFELDP